MGAGEGPETWIELAHSGPVRRAVVPRTQAMFNGSGFSDLPQLTARHRYQASRESRADAERSLQGNL